jgi:hypothetical protein
MKNQLLIILLLSFLPLNCSKTENNPIIKDNASLVIKAGYMCGWGSANYNACNICVDGCDEWISIKNNSVSHQIRFGLGQKIDSKKPLQDLLAELRSEFRQ